MERAKLVRRGCPATRSKWKSKVSQHSVKATDEGCVHTNMYHASTGELGSR